MTFGKLSRTSYMMRLRAASVILPIRKLGSSACYRASNQQDQLKVFTDNATKWWNGKEFSILRSMNEIRVPFIVNGLSKPIEETKIIDVGCGGGILSEPLARLGANVLGIDPVFESINQAQIHSQLDPHLKDRLRYKNCNIEDISGQPEHVENYDALVASEVLEHIEDVESFLVHCSKVIKPSGSLFITTINQTPLSWLGIIFFGEYVLKQIPKGTHTYDMFVSVKGLRIMLERLGFHIRLVNGFMYEPLRGNFYWTPTTLTHYAIQAIKTNSVAKKGINYEQRRYVQKAKAKKLSRPKVPLDYIEMSAVIPMDFYKERADTISADFKDHLEKNLTIRASTAGIETLKVELPGVNEALELRDIAQISMKNSNLIVINLSTMPEALKPVMEAIEKVGSFNPQAEVNNIFVPIPRITREYREDLVANAKKAASSSKDKIKGLFSEFSSKARECKARGVSLDLIHNVIENLKFDTDQRMSAIDDLLQTKANQLLNEKR